MKNNTIPDLSPFLNCLIKVKIKEKGNVIGTLIGYDGFMNMILEDVKVDYDDDCEILLVRGDSIENFLAHK